MELSRDELLKVMDADELKESALLIFANHQDKPQARSAEEVSALMGVPELRRLFPIKSIGVFPSCGLTGDGLYEGIDWLLHALEARRVGAEEFAEQPKEVMTQNSRSDEENRLESMFQEWLTRHDEPDDDFLRSLDDYSLSSWDHRTHLRIAWVLLTKHGRREGLKRIFSGIKKFIENSPRTRRTGSPESRGMTFHETMTYFWSHMVHYAIVATKNPDNTFVGFLLMNPQLSNGGLFLHYYSKQRMLLDPEARSSVLLPDKVPLPSIVGELSNHSAPSEPLEIRLIPKPPTPDDVYISEFKSGKLSGWGHDPKLRVIYLMLKANGRRSDSVDDILNSLEEFERTSTHVTINYFWLQMVTYHMALYAKRVLTAIPGGDSAPEFHAFADFIRHPLSAPLRNQLLYDNYYSRSAIDRGNDSFIIPDIKPLPSVVN
jgi:hypothetical protein